MAWVKRPTPKLVFAWAFAFLLFVVARPTWPTFAVGALPVVLGAAVRIWACGHLEKNKKLTTSGPYAYVQNPLYLGTFLILLGFGVMGGNPWVLVAGAVVFFIYYMPFKRRREGDRLREIFGEEYDAYRHAVPVLFPYKLSPYPRRSSERFVASLVTANSEHGTTLAVAVGLLLMALRAAYPALLRLS